MGDRSNKPEVKWISKEEPDGTPARDTLTLRKLWAEVTEAHLEEIFGHYGLVKSVTIYKNVKAGRAEGEEVSLYSAFVKFKSEDEARGVHDYMAKKSLILDGRKLTSVFVPAIQIDEKMRRVEQQRERMDRQAMFRGRSRSRSRSPYGRRDRGDRGDRDRDRDRGDRDRGDRDKPRGRMEDSECRNFKNGRPCFREPCYFKHVGEYGGSSTGHRSSRRDRSRSRSPYRDSRRGRSRSRTPPRRRRRTPSRSRSPYSRSSKGSSYRKDSKSRSRSPILRMQRR
jgi:hypothetical protein